VIIFNAPYSKKRALEIFKIGINYWQNCTQEPVFFWGVGLNVNGFFREKFGLSEQESSGNEKT
jgi:hypothetical protein